MTYLLEHCLLTISSLLHWVHFAASPSGHNTGFYLNVWYILFGWRMCEGPWTSAVLNCSASSQCTRWNFRLPKFCCFVPFPLLQQPPARMHARARDSIKPRLPRFTGVLSQAGAALALKMLLLRFIVLDFNFVLTNARLYLKRKGKKKKEKGKNTKKNTHCYLSLSSSVVSLECGRTKAPWSSSVSEMLVISLLYQWGPLWSAPVRSWSRVRWDAMTVLACFRVLCWLWELAWEFGGC